MAVLNQDKSELLAAISLLLSSAALKSMVVACGRVMDRADSHGANAATPGNRLLLETQPLVLSSDVPCYIETLTFLRTARTGVPSTYPTLLLS